MHIDLILMHIHDDQIRIVEDVLPHVMLPNACKLFLLLPLFWRPENIIFFL